LRAYRSDLIDPTIAVHNGRVVKRTGDGSFTARRDHVPRPVAGSERAAEGARPPAPPAAGQARPVSGDDQIGHQNLAFGLGPVECRRSPGHAADPRANDHRLG
jgi:hypothetical protein